MEGSDTLERGVGPCFWGVGPCRTSLSVLSDPSDLSDPKVRQSFSLRSDIYRQNTLRFFTLRAAVRANTQVDPEKTVGPLGSDS